MCGGGRLWERFRNAFDTERFAGRGIDFNESALQTFLPFGHAKPLRRVGHETRDDRLDLAPEHASVRPGKAGVTKKRCAAGKNLFVSSLHMRVSANHRAYLAV